MNTKELNMLAYLMDVGAITPLNDILYFESGEKLTDKRLMQIITKSINSFELDNEAIPLV